MEKLIRYADVGKLLGVSIRTVQYWVQKKLIPYFKLGNSVRFSEADVKKWIEMRKVKPLCLN